jgi:hypothetical protein
MQSPICLTAPPSVPRKKVASSQGARPGSSQPTSSVYTVPSRAVTADAYGDMGGAQHVHLDMAQLDGEKCMERVRVDVNSRRVHISLHTKDIVC